jgi:hypothetical protein
MMPPPTTATRLLPTVPVSILRPLAVVDSVPRGRLACRCLPCLPGSMAVDG